RADVGRGGVDEPPAHPRGRDATAVLRQVRRHRCLQRPDDRAEGGSVARCGATADGRDPSPAPRLRPEDARRSAQPREPLPSSLAARCVRPLPAARRGDTAMATKDSGVSQQPFEEIVAEHGPTVLRVCRAVLGRVDAEDAWSETFLAALSAYPRLRANSNIEAWLVTIAHRKALDHLRASRRLVVTDEVPERPAKDGSPEGWESGLWEALEALPLKQRQTIAYHYLVGMPYLQVAEIVGGSGDAARRAAADGIATLRKTFPKGESR